MKTVEFQWQEVDLSDVLKFYSDYFKPKGSEKITRAEAFTDTVKGKVIWRLTVEKEVP